MGATLGWLGFRAALPVGLQGQGKELRFDFPGVVAVLGTAILVFQVL